MERPMLTNPPVAQTADAPPGLARWNLFGTSVLRESPESGHAAEEQQPFTGTGMPHSLGEGHGDVANADPELIRHYHLKGAKVRRGRWKTFWSPPKDLALKPPPGDYRDRLPLRPEVIAEAYKDVVKIGFWTVGLVECWGRKEKVVKSSVHVPCCPSFRFMPWRWRGVCFGRTLQECYWFGCDRARWSRLVYAAGLGREYTLPVAGIGHTGKQKDEICALCWFNWVFSCIAGLGASFGVSVCGNYGINCSACYSCHAREKMRRKYGLPPTFGLPPGIDDCCVHFCCMYCASHQEMRELVLRGVDGYGLSPLDVLPGSWAHVPGFQEEMQHRQRKLKFIAETGLTQPFLPMEQRMTRDHPHWKAMRRTPMARECLTTTSMRHELQKDKDRTPVTTQDDLYVRPTKLDAEDAPLKPGKPSLERWSVAY